MEIESGRLSNQFKHRRLAQQMTPPGFVRAADNDMAHAMIAAKFEQRLDRFSRAQAHDFGAKVAGSLFVFQKMALQRRIDAVTRFAFGFDVNDKPVGV